MSEDEGLQRTEQPEDGMVTDGEHGGAEQEDEAIVGGQREGGAEALHQGSRGLGQLTVELYELASRSPRLSGLPLPPLPLDFLGGALPGLLLYTGHASLCVRTTGC